MKKWFLLVFTLFFVIHMNACGSSAPVPEKDDSPTDSAPADTLPDRDPTEQELEDFSLYGGVLELLDRYPEEKFILFDSVLDHEPVDIDTYEYCINSENAGVTGYNGLKLMRDLLKDMEDVDPWIGTEYVPNISRESVLSRFYVVRDVLLTETVIKYENINTENEYVHDYEVYFWSYNDRHEEDGFYADSHSFSMRFLLNPTDIVYFVCGNPDCFTFSYNRDGQLNRINNPSERYFSEIVIEYDTQAKINGLTGNGAGGDITGTYRYDNDNRVQEIRLSYGTEYILQYEYNESGWLEKFSYTTSTNRGEENVFTYSYDEAGWVTQIDTSDGITWQLSYDDAGRLLKAVSVDENRRLEIVMTYGNYYGYTPS